jgi:hypothetical protein
MSADLSVGTRANWAVSAITKRWIYRGVSARVPKSVQISGTNQTYLKRKSSSCQSLSGRLLASSSKKNLIRTLYGEVKRV